MVLLLLRDLPALDQVVHKLFGVDDHGSLFRKALRLELFWIHVREVVERAEVFHVVVKNAMVFPRHVPLKGLYRVEVLVALQTLLERKYSELNEPDISLSVGAVLFVRD